MVDDASREPTNWLLGQIKPDSMVTKKIQMHEVEEEGFKTLIQDKDNHVKILIEANP